MLKTILSPKKILAASLLCFTFNAYSFEAEKSDILISKDYVERAKIAIADFNYKGDIRPSYEIEKIIFNDLKNSGRFEPLNKNQFPQDIQGDINPQLWVDKDIRLILTGEVQPIILQGKRNFRLQYKLFDVSGNLCSVGSACINNEITLTEQEVRDLGHSAANEIYKRYLNVNTADFLTKVAYIYQKDQGISGYKLVVSDYDGYNPKVLYSSNEPLSSPTWSNDGNKIAFSSFGLFSSNILEYDLQTKKVRTLVKKLGNNSSPAYSPDDQRLAYTHTENGRSDIYIKNLANGNDIKVTSVGRNTEPTWYGNSLIFTSDRNGVAAIYQSSANGSNPTLISQTKGQTTNAKLNHDNNLMVMINNDRIVAQDLKTGEVKQLSTTLYDESVTLSPTGNMAIYTYSNSNNTKRLNLVTTDGSVKIKLNFPVGDTYYPAWSK